MKKHLYPILFLYILFLVGCGSNSTPPSPCVDPTPAQCLDDAYCADCEQKGVDIETVCGTVLKDHFNASNRQLDLVPELSGTENTLRDRYDISYADQPYLYVPTSVVPETYYMRSARFNLLNINDRLLATTTLQPLLPDLEFNPTVSPWAASKSNGFSLADQLIKPIMATQPKYMFNGLGYNRDILQSYLDSLYTGKVAAWNENEARVESCEEYAYEKFYDFSLFKDFMALHDDDHLRIVEYAYRGAGLDQDGIYVDENELKPGSIGTKFMSTFTLQNLSTPLSDVIQRKGGEPRSIFEEMSITYYFDPEWGYSRFDKTQSTDMNVEVYWDHVFSKNRSRIVCSNPIPECIIHPERDFMPKNFFVEVLGNINKTNQDRLNGIVLSNQGLLDLIGTDEMNYAMDCYNNSFKYHFLMLKAAKELYPGSTVLKNKLLEFKLLRKHLIQLMAERAYYEEFSFISGRFSERVLTGSETLPPSEKNYAAMKLEERINNQAASKPGTHSKATPIENFDDGIDIIDPDITDGLVSVESILQNIDDQIEAILLEAQKKGCLEIALWDPEAHNYPTANNDGETIDFLFDKALSDWTPEMFTTSAITLIPESYYENVYADCMRVTGGDFEQMNEGMSVDHYRFQFPSQCEDNELFSIWNPNEFRDYTENTVEFHKFESLVKKYPEALLDCDAIIQGQTKKDLSEADMNYFDPATGKVMMSKSRSYYDSMGGEYAGLEFGYALGWLYEGYDDIASIQTQNINNRDFVCENTGFFAFGNYFAGGSFLTRDFTLCSAGSYASNKTSGASRPVPPTLAASDNEDRINGDINAVASETGVNTRYFMFIKNEKMTFSYDNNGNFNQTPVETTHSELFSGDTLTYQSPAPEAQMIKVEMEKSIPICGIISITIRGKVTGDIDAATTINTDRHLQYVNDGCKTLNFSFTPQMDFDAFAQASVTAGISGVAGVSAGVETGLKFIGIDFPYTTNLFVSQGNGSGDDRDFNYDINVNAYNSLDQEMTLLSGFFGAFVKIDYLLGSDTYRQTLFSWDGIKFTGNVDRVGQHIDGEMIPLAIPVRALYGLSQNLYQKTQ